MEGIRITVCAVRSPEDDDPAPDVPGVLYASAPNQPVSDKWNTAAASVPGDVDGVMIVGSDDLVSAGYIAEAVRLTKDDADVIVGSDAVFVCTETGRAARCTYHRMGGGRLLTRATMDRLRWQPWPPGLARRLDAGMDRRLRGVFTGTAYREASVAPGAGRYVVDLKSPVNLWSFDHVASGGAPLDASARRSLRQTFPTARHLIPMAKRKTTTTAAAKDAPTRVRLLATLPGSMLPDAEGKARRAGDVFVRGTEVETANAAALIHAGHAEEV